MNINVPPTANVIASWLDQLHLEDRISEPYYLQLQRQIEALMRSGVLSPGNSLPSERDMAELLNVSRATVKRTYDELRRAGLLFSRGRRSGTVVQNVPRVTPALDLNGIAEEIQELKHMPAIRVLERAVVNDRTVASMFGRLSQAGFLRLVRLHLADGVPMSREIAWYDLSLAPELVGWSGEGAARDFLRERCSLNLTWAKQSIEAVMSSREEAEAFGFAAPAPCLLLKRLSYTADDKLVEYAENTFRGDAYRYQTKLGL